MKLLKDVIQNTGSSVHPPPLASVGGFHVSMFATRLGIVSALQQEDGGKEKVNMLLEMSVLI